jgi:drug/metabolite transporter (DMT)-like permease
MDVLELTITIQEPFTIREALASAIAFTGVLFVARPSFLFPIHDPVSKNLTQHLEMIYSTVMINTGGGIIPPVPVTPSQRSWAVFWAIFGSFGAALAYATIRVIGKRTHSLVSVNYFAVLATVVSFLGLILHPDLSFKMPQTIVQWLVFHRILNSC